MGNFYSLEPINIWAVTFQVAEVKMSSSDTTLLYAMYQTTPPGEDVQEMLRSLVISGR